MAIIICHCMDTPEIEAEIRKWMTGLRFEAKLIHRKSIQSFDIEVENCYFDDADDVAVDLITSTSVKTATYQGRYGMHTIDRDHLLQSVSGCNGGSYGFLQSVNCIDVAQQ